MNWQTLKYSFLIKNQTCYCHKNLIRYISKAEISNHVPDEIAETHLQSNDTANRNMMSIAYITEGFGAFE